MSRASKLTFAFSTTFAVATTVGVYYLQQFERDALKLGPEKDAKRVAQYNSKQAANLKDFELQKKLKQEFETHQPLTGEIVQGQDK
ncbi:hypothetical protein PACTADRAFT_86685 [Pachysolen tannophilus NRRL Y-2460]|uniref:Uncharacterized protein n=1 Tax=Pachysolen tannophilus NRRL Y-2460 TaxID=669874 RepID=A0A1E4TPB1_PACTA|nr:hypothetical protein PACTADRAFT_86685 [Pachysolen tannophilus NRRL Y-2460]